MNNLSPPSRHSALRILRHLFGPRRIQLVSHLQHPTQRASLQTDKRKQLPTTQKWLLPFSIITLIACGGAYLAIQKGHEAFKDQIDPTVFHPFKLVSKESVSSTCSIFTLRSYTGSCRKIYHDVWKHGNIWSVEIKQPQLQIARSYTPLPPPALSDAQPYREGISNDCEVDFTELRFLIRHETHGEVSGYLHSLPIGAFVYARGPHVEFELLDDLDEVLFIAGGTGISPALQVAHSFLKRRESAGSMPTMRILWANRRREDASGGLSHAGGMVDPSDIRRKSSWNTLFWAFKQLPSVQQQPLLLPLSPPHAQSTSKIVTELDQLKSHVPDMIKIDFFFDEDNSYLTPDILKHYIPLYHPPAHTSRSLEPSTSTATLTSPQRKRKSKLIMISGPEGFVTYLAGPKGLQGLQGPRRQQARMGDGHSTGSQGALGGCLRDVLEGRGDLGLWEVWKL